MAYPQHTKIHGMIELLYRELQKAYEQGGARAAPHLLYRTGSGSLSGWQPCSREQRRQSVGRPWW